MIPICLFKVDESQILCGDSDQLEVVEECQPCSQFDMVSVSDFMLCQLLSSLSEIYIF